MLGDAIEKVAKPIAKALRLSCLDEQGKLKPESGCAKRRDKLNNLFKDNKNMSTPTAPAPKPKLLDGLDMRRSANGGWIIVPRYGQQAAQPWTAKDTDEMLETVKKMTEPEVKPATV